MRASVFARAHLLTTKVDHIYEIWWKFIPLQATPNFVLLEVSSILRRYADW